MTRRIVIQEWCGAECDLLDGGVHSSTVLTEPDYVAALNVLIIEDANGAAGLSMTDVRKAVDAALFGEKE